MSSLESKKCPKCGNPMEYKLSGQVADYLGLSNWPCLKCEIITDMLVVSSGGIALEFPPVLITIQKKGDYYEMARGFGSIAIPDSNPLYNIYKTGGEIIDILKKLSEIMNKLKSKDKTIVEFMLRKQWGM